MKTIRVDLKPLVGNLHEGILTPVNLGLVEAWEKNIPWLLPNRGISIGMPTGFEWLAVGTVARWRHWAGTPAIDVRMVKDKDGKVVFSPPTSKIYELGVGEPDMNADSFMANVVGGRTKLLFFDVGADPGTVLYQLEEYGVQQGIAIDNALASKRLAVYPLEIAHDVLFRESDNLLDLGWTARPGSWYDGTRKLKGEGMVREWRPWEFLEVRYWHNPRKITDPETYEGRAVIQFCKGLTKTLCKVRVADGDVPFDPKKEVVLPEDVENAPVALAFPVDEEKAYRQISTPLKYLDEIQIPRTHCKGTITIKELCSFIGRMLGVTVTTGEECGQALGDYYKSIEKELVDALEPPRMLVSGEAGDKANTWLAMTDRTCVPKTSEMPAVQTAVRRIWTDGDETAEWVTHLLCRAAVVLHLRHGTMFSADFRTQMYEPGQLMHSVIRASEKDKANYLTQFVLVANIKKQRGQRVLAPPKAKPQNSPLTAGGVNFDDLFK
jgi:hypothetical protein